MSEEPKETVNPPQIENADIVDQENSQKVMTPGQAESRQESQTLTGEGHPEKDVPSVKPALEVTEGHDDHHSDTVVLPFINQTVTVPGGIYTVVFVGLGALTLIEVLLGSVIPSGTIKVVALLAIAVLKALLVVMFYMHLRTDNPIFRLVLGLPLLIVILSMMYLIAVPPAGGLGYLPPPGAAQAAEASTSATQEALAVGTQEATADATQDAAAIGTQDALAVVTQEALAVGTQEAAADVTQEAPAVTTQEAAVGTQES
jgi:caa(3)-type oxidase subunit IV